MSSHVFNRYLFTVFFAILVGCEDSPTPSSNSSLSNSGATNSDLSNTLQADLRLPTDKSLTLIDYIQAGMPAHDRSWSGADMTRAANILVAIARKDVGQLPRYQSQRSGEAFERLTADDNLGFYRNRSLPIEQRLPDALNYMESSNQIHKSYLAAFNQHAVGDSELVELTGAQLRLSVVMIHLVNEFLPTLDKDDPTYPVRMKGLEGMKNGMAIIVAGSLQTLTESHAYRTSELKRLVGYMQDTFPDILRELPAGTRSETLVRLQTFLDDPKMQHLKPELAALLAVVAKAAEPERAP